jgi:hypothetical protein
MITVALFVTGWLIVTALIYACRSARRKKSAMTITPASARPPSGSCQGAVSPQCACDGSCARLASAGCGCLSCYLFTAISNASFSMGGGGSGSSPAGGAGSSGSGSGGSSGTTWSSVATGAGRSSSASSFLPAVRSNRAGVPGFDGAGSKEFEFAVGSVRGLRQWAFTGQAALDAALAVEADPDITVFGKDYKSLLLTGVTGMAWQPGVNEARCNNDRRHEPPVEADARGGACGCGFWGYWAMSDKTWHERRLPVYGIIEGSGRVLIGTKGFRCQKARIIALAPGFTVEDPFGSQESRQRSEAWLAISMDLLGQLYPDARVFATVRGMLACVPPGEVTE